MSSADLLLGMAIGRPSPKVVHVPADFKGHLHQLSRMLGSSSTLALIAGTDANLSLSGLNIDSSDFIANATSQVAVVREELDGIAVQYPVTFIGTPGAPSLSAPKLVSSPVISNVAGTLSVVSAAVFTDFTGSPVSQYASDGVLIPGATAATYAYNAGTDIGELLQLQTKATNSSGLFTTAWSNASITLVNESFYSTDWTVAGQPINLEAIPGAGWSQQGGAAGGFQVMTNDLYQTIMTGASNLVYVQNTGSANARIEATMAYSTTTNENNGTQRIFILRRADSSNYIYVTLAKDSISVNVRVAGVNGSAIFTQALGGTNPSLMADRDQVKVSLIGTYMRIYRNGTHLTESYNNKAGINVHRTDGKEAAYGSTGTDIVSTAIDAATSHGLKGSSVIGTSPTLPIPILYDYAIFKPVNPNRIVLDPLAADDLSGVPTLHITGTIAGTIVSPEYAIRIVNDTLLDDGTFYPAGSVYQYWTSMSGAISGSALDFFGIASPPKFNGVDVIVYVRDATDHSTCTSGAFTFDYAPSTGGGDGSDGDGDIGGGNPPPDGNPRPIIYPLIVGMNEGTRTAGSAVDTFRDAAAAAGVSQTFLVNKANAGLGLMPLLASCVDPTTLAVTSYMTDPVTGVAFDCIDFKLFDPNVKNVRYRPLPTGYWKVTYPATMTATWATTQNVDVIAPSAGVAYIKPNPANRHDYGATLRLSGTIPAGGAVVTCKPEAVRGGAADSSTLVSTDATIADYAYMRTKYIRDMTNIGCPGTIGICPSDTILSTNTRSRIDRLIALANETGQDLLLNIHPQATPANAAALAAYVKTYLNPGRKVIIEFANEIWNYHQKSNYRVAYLGVLKGFHIGDGTTAGDQVIYGNSDPYGIIVKKKISTTTPPTPAVAIPTPGETKLYFAYNSTLKKWVPNTAAGVAFSYGDKVFINNCVYQSLVVGTNTNTQPVPNSDTSDANWQCIATQAEVQRGKRRYTAWISKIYFDAFIAAFPGERSRVICYVPLWINQPLAELQDLFLWSGAPLYNLFDVTGPAIYWGAGLAENGKQYALGRYAAAENAKDSLGNPAPSTIPGWSKATQDLFATDPAAWLDALFAKCPNAITLAVDNAKNLLDTVAAMVTAAGRTAPWKPLIYEAQQSITFLDYDTSGVTNATNIVYALQTQYHKDPRSGDMLKLFMDQLRDKIGGYVTLFESARVDKDAEVNWGIMDYQSDRSYRVTALHDWMVANGM